MKKVKKYIQLLVVILLVLVGFSCERESFNRFGFDSPFSKNSEGLVLMQVDQEPGVIYLEGEILVEEGCVEVQLINPGNVPVYFCLIKSEGTNEINKIIPAVKGIWKLKYTSINGSGAIDLHAGF